MNSLGTCYVCTREVEDVPQHVRLAARREMNVAVNYYPKQPECNAALRHSYCAPGTATWARHVDRNDPRDRAWLQRFGFDPIKENDMAKTKKARAPKVKIAAGTILRREYNGKDYEIRVGVEGFTMNGDKFTSLTAVAKKITGYKTISGPKFFEKVLAEKAAA